MSCLQGAPVEVMQDPLHYPHGTKWMAPGPLGQCHPLPDDENIKLEMMRVAKNHKHIYDMYNFDWDPEPGSVNYVINQRIRRGAELQGKQLLRIADVLEDVEAEVEAEKAAAAAAAGTARAPQPVATVAEAAALSTSSSGAGFSWPWQQQREQQQQQQPGPSSSSRGSSAPFASLSMSAVAAGGSGVWLPGPMATCSMSLDVGRASKAVLNTMARAARRAPSMQVGIRMNAYACSTCLDSLLLAP